MKHLQIGDVFYVIDGLKVYCEKVRAIALEPNGDVVYNWKYSKESIHTDLNKVIIALQEESDALIDRLKKDLKGGE